MPRLTNGLRIFLQVASVPAVLGGLVWGGDWILRQDVLAGYRKPLPDGMMDTDGIGMNEVRIRQYSGPVMVTAAKVDKLRIRNDRQLVNFEGVRQGTYAGKDGKIQFESPNAVWQASIKQLVVAQNSHVWDKNLDLSVGAFTVDKQTSVLNVPGNFSGKFFGGMVVGNNLRYNLKTTNWTMGPIEWNGELPKEVQETAPVGKTRSKWSIKAPGGSSSDGKKTTYLNVVATDGEIVVKADKAVHDLKADIMTCTGKVSYFSTKADLSADSVVIYRKEKRVVATGNVNSWLRSKEVAVPTAQVREIPPFRPELPENLAAKQPPTVNDTNQVPDLRDPNNARKYPISATASKIEYWYGKGARRANLAGPVQAYQELPDGNWRRMTAPNGSYDGEKDTLKFIASPGAKNVRMKDSWQDNIVCTLLTLSTKDEDTNSWNAENMEGDVYTQDDDVPRIGNGGGAPAPATGGGGVAPKKPQPKSEIGGKGFRR